MCPQSLHENPHFASLSRRRVHFWMPLIQNAPPVVVRELVSFVPVRPFLDCSLSTSFDGGARRIIQVDDNRQRLNSGSLAAKQTLKILPDESKAFIAMPWCIQRAIFLKLVPKFFHSSAVSCHMVHSHRLRGVCCLVVVSLRGASN